MTDTATLSRKFQISIPKNVRAAHDWQAGQEFAFIPGQFWWCTEGLGIDIEVDVDSTVARSELQLCIG